MPPAIDDIIDSLAATQHGVVTRAQLLRAGVPAHVVSRRVTRGRLRPLHAGVYRVGPVVSPRSREMAAVLASEAAAVSHRSAAALSEWTAAQRPSDPVDVTLLEGGRGGRRPGIRAHRNVLRTDEITRIDGIPVTTPARTLLDLSGVMSPRELERALAAAERADSALRTHLTALLDRHAGRAGSGRLRNLIQRSTAPALTRSEAEERLLALIRAGGLPEPETNVVLHGYEVDCYWRHTRLVVEVDGYAYHGSTRAFSRDRQRDSALAAAGIQVVRLGWRQIHDQREKTLVQLALALARAPGRAPP